MFDFSRLDDDDKDELLKQMQEDVVKGDFNLATEENRSGDIIGNYIRWRISEDKDIIDANEYTTNATIHMGEKGMAQKEMK